MVVSRGESETYYHGPSVAASSQKEARYGSGDSHRQGTGSEDHAAHQGGELVDRYGIEGYERKDAHGGHSHDQIRYVCRHERL